MDIKGLTRDPGRVKRAVKANGDKLIAQEKCAIYIPERFVEQGLAYIGAETNILAIYALVLPDNTYAISLTCAMMRIKPSSTSTVKVNDDVYREFSFEPGDVIIDNLNLVKNDVLPFDVYEEMFAKGRVPWYMGYEDLSRVFENSPTYTGVRVGANAAVVELMTAAICRNPGNRTQYYRHVVESKQDLLKRPPVAIPLKDVSLGATNTTAKLMGSYFEDGVTSALVNPSDRAEPIETLLRR